MPEPSAFEFEMVIEKLKSHKSPGTGQITAKMFKAGGRTICCENHKLINSITGFHSILARWRNHFPQLLNVHGVNDVRQTEIHTA